MDYNLDYHGIPSEQELFQLSTSSRSPNDGQDAQTFDDLFDFVDENHSYAYEPVAHPDFERDQPETTIFSDRYHTPVPQSQSEGYHFDPSANVGSHDSLSPDPLFTFQVDPHPIRYQQIQQTKPIYEVEPNKSHSAQFSRRSSENLIPVTVLPEPYLPFFGFTHFNSIQSKCFSIVYKTNHNVLASAPTGSGKTVIFELAMLRMLEYNQKTKAVYMAPTKSLCAERFRDWSRRFDLLGIKCVELTGDSEFSSLADAKLANLIITTPEKWDSMTRRWFDFTKVLSALRLVCIDEVHMLNEERGSVLEVIVARMKTLGTNIRLIAVSATVPNISDVAEWLGDGGVADQEEKALPGQAPAKTFIFGEEHRPVKLSKFVYGFPRRPEQTEYQFMSLLNFKLMDKIVSHSSRKPTLIFCGTRKSSLQAAEILSKAYQKMSTGGDALPWDSPTRPEAFSDKKLTELYTHGIGIHHAGLDQNDRRQTERLFSMSKISVLCTTSTLSVGVNLPARCVIIRGTKTYRGATAGKEGFQEYSDLDLFQMMGRAGRPQFDEEGVTVVMTSQNDKMRIEKLVKSQTTLESCLHYNLTEHINSEIYMGTIISRNSAIDWLENSFLSVRIKKNPKHYSIGDADVAPEQQLAAFADDALDVLVQDGLIEEDENHAIATTELGEIMSKFCLRHKTFLGLIHMKPDATIRDILEVISSAEEYSTLRLRAGEGMAYKALNSHPELKCPLPGKVTQTWHKVMLLIQAVLGGIPLTEVKSENTNPTMEVNIIWQHLPRICKCLVALSIAQHNSTIKNCLDVLRSVTAKAWDDSPWVLRQLDQIGEKSVKRLVDSGVSTIEKLQNTPNHRIEMVLDRNPPFGTRIARQARSIPRFFCRMETISEVVVSEGVHVCVEVTVGLSDTGETTAWKWKNSILMATVLVMTNDQKWIEFRTIQVKLLLETKRFNIECILIKPSQTLSAYVACTQIAGTGLSIRWKPQTPRESYPKPGTITDDEAASLDVLKGLSTKDLVMSDSEPECEIVKPSSPAHCPTHKEEIITSKSDTKGSNLKGAVQYHSLPGREKLKNGRYKCAHRCKGTCHHICCKEGVRKPPRIRAQKYVSPPPEPRDSQSNKASFVPQNQRPLYERPLPSKLFGTTNMTHKAEGSMKLHQVSPTNSFQIEPYKPTGRRRPIRLTAPKPKHVDDNFVLPSLTELEKLDRPEREETLFRYDASSKERSQCAESISQEGLHTSVHFSSPQTGRIGGIQVDKKVGDEYLVNQSHEASGIEKFRSKTKIVNDFDEREIFHQRQEPDSPCDSLEPEPLSAKNYPPTPSPPNAFQLVPTGSRDKDLTGTENLDDENQTDELDEDWDIKIFEGYLAPDSESVDEPDTQTQSVKRNNDQMEGRELSATLKKPRLDSSRGSNFSPQPLARPDVDFPTLTEEDGIQTEENPPAGKSYKSVDCNSDTENESDPLMSMVDEVMAWAESHVAEE